jgi:hypothetical protein
MGRTEVVSISYPTCSPKQAATCTEIVRRLYSIKYPNPKRAFLV